MSDPYDVTDLKLEEENEENIEETTMFNTDPITTIEPLLINDKYPPNFKKKNLEFDDIKIVSSEFSLVSDELKEIQNRLDKAASQVLFRWQDVPIAFPPSITGIDNPNAKSQILNTNDLFKIPLIDELDEVATDRSTGKTKRLNNKQLESIRLEGSFEVDSKNFPGKTHKWVLARWLQKGKNNTNKSFYHDLSIALGLIIITAKRRFYSKTFSFLEGLKSWKNGFRNLFDIMFGLSEMNVVYYHEKLREDAEKYLVSDLVIDPKDLETLNKFCEDIRLSLDNPKYNKKNWSLPCYFQTSTNLKIDLRLFDKSLREKIDPIISNILKLDQNEKLLLDKLRNETISLYKNEKLDDNEIIKRTTKVLFKEFMNIVNNKILKNADLEKISPGISKLLVEQSRSVLIMRNISKKFDDELEQHIQNYENELKSKYKIKSLVRSWLNECIADERRKFIEKNIYTVHLRSIEKCNEEGLYQAAYFIQREMDFLKNHKDGLIENYEKIKEPKKKFTFYRQIWFPKNYIIKEYTDKAKKKDYYIEKSIEYNNSTKYPFWRWSNFFLRTWVNLSNSFFFFGIVVPFCSHVSFRALFSRKPFRPGKDVDKTTGKLVPSGPVIQTFLSRIGAIWRHISVSRKKFEDTPDKGLIGKSVQRFFNRIWNYVIKGFIGTTGLIIVFPALCLTVSTISLAISLLSPVWYPLVSLLQHLAFIFIFDWDYPYNNTLKKFFRFFQIFIWDFLICGIAQPISALATSLILCPIGSLAVIIYSISCVFSRKVWDGFVYHVILKRQAKVPSHDTFVARRVAGPGLASNYFFQAKPEQILASLEAHLEKKIVNSYLDYVKYDLNKPLDDYRKFFEPIFKRYSFILDHELNGSYKNLSLNVTNNINRYIKEADKRIEKLNKLINNKNLNKIRLADKDLTALMIQAEEMVRLHYQESILKFRKKQISKFFEEKSLEENDWNSIAGFELEEIFGVGILTPLEETDCFFELKVDHLDLNKYSKMIARAEIRDDLDIIQENYKPKSDRIIINRPEGDISLYKATSDQSYHFNSRESKCQAIMTIPTSIPDHLAVTSVIVNNKSNEHNKITIQSFNEIKNAVNRHNAIYY